MNRYNWGIKSTRHIFVTPERDAEKSEQGHVKMSPVVNAVKLKKIFLAMNQNYATVFRLNSSQSGESKSKRNNESVNRYSFKSLI